MFGARRERHMRTRIRERRRRREPDATPRTRYERALAVETERGGGVELDCHVSPKSVEASKMRPYFAASAKSPLRNASLTASSFFASSSFREGDQPFSSIITSTGICAAS